MLCWISDSFLTNHRCVETITPKYADDNPIIVKLKRGTAPRPERWKLNKIVMQPVEVPIGIKELFQNQVTCLGMGD